MEINPDKTPWIFIESRRYLAKKLANLAINFENFCIRPNIFVKSLFIHLDRFMTFENPVHTNLRKVRGTLIYVSHIKIESFLKQTVVLSLIKYCSNLWGAADRCQIQIKKLQKFTARVALGTVIKYTPFINNIRLLFKVTINPHNRR